MLHKGLCPSGRRGTWSWGVCDMRSKLLTATSGLRCSNNSSGLVMRLPLLIWWHPESFMEGVSQPRGGSTCTVYRQAKASSIIQCLPVIKMNMDRALLGCGYSCGCHFRILCFWCLVWVCQKEVGGSSLSVADLKGLIGFVSTWLCSKTSKKFVFLLWNWPTVTLQTMISLSYKRTAQMNGGW